MRDLFQAARDGGADAALERLTAGFMGVLIGEDAVAVAMLDDHVAALRDQGALGWLPYAMEPLSLAQLVTGRFRDAEANVTEAASLAAELAALPASRELTLSRTWATTLLDPLRDHFCVGVNARHAQRAIGGGGEPVDLPGRDDDDRAAGSLESS
jgi:hypothetical protein